MNQENAPLSLLLCYQEQVKLHFRSQRGLQSALAQSRQPQSCARPWGAVGVSAWQGLHGLWDPPGSARGRFSHRKSLQRIPGRNSPAKSPHAGNTCWDGHQGSYRQEWLCPVSLLGSVTIWEKLWISSIVPSSRPARAPLPSAATFELCGLTEM